MPVAGRSVLLTGPGGSVRLDGPEAAAFAARLAVLADGTRTALEVLAGLMSLPTAQVDRWMADLAAAGHLVEIAAGTPATAQALAGLGLTADAIGRLADARIAVLGGDPIADAAANALVALGAGVDVVDTPAASRNDVAAAAEGATAVVASLQPGKLQMALWANLTVLDRNIPAIFGSAVGTTGWAGPLVFPGEGPCLLCYRLRAVACADDFEDAMAIEEWAARSDVHSSAAPFWPLTATLGGILAVELLKVVTALAEPVLVGAVLEIDGLTHERTRHNVLQRRDCPGCRKKGRPPRRSVDQPRWPVDLASLAPDLVSRHCGVVRSLDRMPADVTEPAVTVLRSEVANNQLRKAGNAPFQPCSGKGLTQADACRSALGEACERYSATAWPAAAVRRARPDELTASLGPDDIVLFADEQYSRLPFARWDEGAELGWVASVDLTTGDPVAIPAVVALFGYDGSEADHLFAPNSNGLASGSTFGGAVVAAALEVIERDSFVMSWMHRLPGTRVDPTTVEQPVVRRLAEQYRRRDISLELYRLPTDVAGVTVCLAIAVQLSDRVVGRGPTAIIGLGADLSHTAAAAKAVLEVAQVRPALKVRLRDPDLRRRRDELAGDPSRVETLEDHDLLFAHPDLLAELAFWRDEPAVAADDAFASEAAPMSNGDRLAPLIAGLAAAGHRLVACDLTAPELAVFGIHAAKAVIPGFQPIHFGAGQERLGGSRLYRLPYELRLRPAIATVADLNRLPHPLS